MKKLYSIVAMIAAVTGSALAQVSEPSHDAHVTWSPADGTEWYTAYTAMDVSEIGTKTLYGAYDSDAEMDENFFISRVKPRDRFTFTGTQVKESLSAERKLLWWCPIGKSGWNALPTSFFGGEVYSAWNYTDVYGNWTAGFIRMPGAMTDICHKNGVQTSVLASVPWAESVSLNDGSWGSIFGTMIDGGAEKLLKFLRYYGIDGIGFNSEFYFSDFATEMKDLLSSTSKLMYEQEWPTYHNCWYSLVSNNGGSVGASYSYLTSNNSDWFHYDGAATSNAYFMNYDATASNLSTAQTVATSFSGRSAYDVYAGINYQDGSEVAFFTSLLNYNISLGLWGAHDMNMLYENRGENGSAAETLQKTYQLMTENSFTGSTFNPINTPEITGQISRSSNATDFHGFSSFITARSSLTTDDLATEPFITYFNLGNGNFFNIEGETTHNGEWYNIGVQDYLPTWRWWWTNKYLGKEDADVSTDLTAEFTWDDAWFGGSCLQVSGQTEDAYLQIFKTKYATQTTDYLTIRYKVVSGSGSMAWACSTEEASATEISSTIMTNQTETEEWVLSQVSLAGGRSGMALSDVTVAQIGLKFSDTSSDFKVLIGEIALTRGQPYTGSALTVTPGTPTVESSKQLEYNYNGYGMKIIFNMDAHYSTGYDNVPVYNSDVDTWYYRIYAQQEGGEAKVVGATTSWAAYQCYIEYDEELGTTTTRMGVSAVGLDGVSESDIAWGDYLELEEYIISEGFSIDKTVIKPNEEFTVSLDDAKHSVATWRILDSETGEELASATALGLTTSLAEVGIYDLEVTMDVWDDDTEAYVSSTDTYSGFIQISPDNVGATPTIYSLTANGEENAQVDIDTMVNYEYTGRDADGQVSRGVYLPESAYIITADQLGFSGTSTFSLAFWVYFTKLEGSTQFLNIRSAEDSWPASDWGYVWSTIEEDGSWSLSLRQGENGGYVLSCENFTFKPGAWYHVAVAFDYTTTRNISYYINGEFIESHEPTEDELVVGNGIYGWLSTNFIAIGGVAYGRGGVDGYIDDYQLYNTAIDETEAARAMEGAFSQEEIPSNLIGYWDFEADPATGNEFVSAGSDTSLTSGMYEIVTTSEGNNTFTGISATMAAGCPFLTGDYVVSTTSAWTYSGATLMSSPSGDATSGALDVKYANYGDYTATVKLTNSWGSDTESITVQVISTTGIEDVTVEEMMAYPNPFKNTVYVSFAEAGDYTIEVYNAAGMLISASALQATAGTPSSISVNGEAGIYFIKVKSADSLLKVMKVIKE